MTIISGVSISTVVEQSNDQETESWASEQSVVTTGLAPFEKGRPGGPPIWKIYLGIVALLSFLALLITPLVTLSGTALFVYIGFLLLAIVGFLRWLAPPIAPTDRMVADFNKRLRKEQASDPHG